MTDKWKNRLIKIWNFPGQIPYWLKTDPTKITLVGCLGILIFGICTPFIFAYICYLLFWPWPK